MSNVPSNMTAIAIREFGGPEVLVAEQRPRPGPEPEEVLVRVAAAGVNRPDVFQRQGNYPPPPGASDIPGLEIAGTVVGLGPAARRYKLGDRVMGLVAGGGYAEYCTVHWSNALPVPPNLSFVEAAAIPETFFTVWHNVFQRGGLQRGETLLVHGGSSGIGTTAIQLAKAFGAQVLVTVGSDEKGEACMKLGAARAINYRRSDFVAETRDATGGKGADLILDIVGGDYVERNYDAAAINGRVVQISFQSGARAMTDVAKLMVKRLTHTGSTLRARLVSEKAAIAEELEEKVWPLLVGETLAPAIYQTFPLREAARAHALMEASLHIGKIVLTCNPVSSGDATLG
jgi:NADPH2:quinone reductase